MSLLLIAFFSCVSAQDSWRVHGVVLGAQGSLSFATVYITDLQKSDSIQQKILSFTTTDDDGSFSLEVSSETLEIQLICNHLGYDREVVNVTRGTKMPLSVVMHLQKNDLNEILVTEERLPAESRGDTIVYNASKFRDSTELTVEDLLRKMPGIEVESDGQIKVGGKPIKKLMIEGTDLFGRQYTIGTKNIAADYIKSVEVINHYQENEVYKNIVKSEDIALNLKLNKDAKNILSGDFAIGLGYGKQAKIQTNATLFYIGKKQKSIWINNTGNTGRQFNLEDLKYTHDFDLNDLLTSPVEDMRTFTQRLNTQTLGVVKSLTDNSFNTFNTIRSFYQIGSYLELKTSATMGTQDDGQQSLEQTTFLYESSSYTNEVSQSIDFKNRLAHFDITLKYLHPIQKHSVDFYVQFYNDAHNGFQEFGEMTDSVSSTISARQLKLNNLFASSVYRQRVSAQSALSVIGSYNYVQMPETFTTNSRDAVNFILSNIGNGELYQDLSFSNHLFSFLTTYSHRFNSFLLESSTRFTRSLLHFQNNLTTKSSNDTTSLWRSAWVDNQRNTLWVSDVTIKKSFASKTNVVMKNKLFYQFNDAFSESSVVPLWDSWSFYLNFRHLFGRKSKGVLSYEFRNNPLESNDFLQGGYFTGVFGYREEWPKNRLPGRHRLRLFYAKENTLNLSAYYVGVVTDWKSRQWISDFNFYNSVVLSRPFFNQDNNFRMRWYGKWKGFIPKTKTSLEFFPSYTMTIGEVVLGESASKTVTHQVDARYRVAFRISSKINFNMEGLVGKEFFKNVDAGESTSLVNLRLVPFLSYSFKDWSVKSVYHYFRNVSEQQNFEVMGGSLIVEKRFKIGKENANLKLSINNLLNGEAPATIASGDYLIFENEVEAVPPFVLVNFSYSL